MSITTSPRSEDSVREEPSSSVVEKSGAYSPTCTYVDSSCDGRSSAIHPAKKHIAIAVHSARQNSEICFPMHKFILYTNRIFFMLPALLKGWVMSGVE